MKRDTKMFGKQPGRKKIAEHPWDITTIGGNTLVMLTDMQLIHQKVETVPKPILALISGIDLQPIHRN